MSAVYRATRGSALGESADYYTNRARDGWQLVWIEREQRWAWQYRPELHRGRP